VWGLTRVDLQSGLAKEKGPVSGEFELIFGPLLGRDGGDISVLLIGSVVHGVFGQVAAFAGLPLVMHVGEDGADETDDRRFVREDAHDSGSRLISRVPRTRDAAFTL
jgi:hypothetical protein